MGAVVYDEFQTTSDDLVADLRALILSQSDWTALPTWYAPLSTFSAAEAAGQTTLSVLNASTFFYVGQRIVLSPGTASEEEATVLTVPNTSSITTAPIANAHASGATIAEVHANSFECTKPTGEQMVVSLKDTNTARMAVDVYRSHDGVAGLAAVAEDKMDGYVRWANVATAGMPLHVIASIGPEHLFISVAGPRPGEPGAESSQQQQYLLLDSVVPYADADATSPVALILGETDAAQSMSSVAYISTGGLGETWAVADIATVHRITGTAGNDPMQVEREDGTRFMWPLLAVERNYGPRGRLASFLFAGQESSYGVIQGRRLTHNGLTYIAVRPGRAGANNSSGWTPLTGQNSYNTGAVLPLTYVPMSGTPS